METLDVLLHQELYYQPSASNERQRQLQITRECRSAMASWCDQCVDFCKFGREPVEIALNYMDRFVTTTVGQARIVDRGSYQLATMAALYAAIKIHQPEALSSDTVAALSRGRYTKEQMEEMERTLLVALEWRLHPVTSMSFVRQYLALFPNDLFASCTDNEADQDNNLLSSITELAKIQTQLAVRDNSFLSIRPSVIAYGALVNALESTNALDPSTLKAVAAALAQSIGGDAQELYSVQRRLCMAVLEVSSPASSPKGMSSSTASACSATTARRRPLVACTNNNSNNTQYDNTNKQRRMSEETRSPRTATAAASLR